MPKLNDCLTESKDTLYLFYQARLFALLKQILNWPFFKLSLALQTKEGHVLEFHQKGQSKTKGSRYK